MGEVFWSVVRGFMVDGDSIGDGPHGMEGSLGRNRMDRSQVKNGGGFNLLKGE